MVEGITRAMGKNKGNYNEWQGKRKDQVEFSEKLASSSMIAMIVIILIAWIMKIV